MAGLIYTISRQALDENYAKGFRVFEIDFNYTQSGELVCVHDWGHSVLDDWSTEQAKLKNSSTICRVAREE